MRAKARIGRLAVYMGTDLAAAVSPPAWSFGDDPRIADELLGHVLSGRKSATSSARAEYGPDEPLPRVGELSILLDGEGRPRALVRTTAVDLARFDEVDEAFAAAEGEDDLSLGSWREQHEIYWRRVLGDDGFDPGMEVVLERFELLDPRVG
ncbi:ASCH domain-containing protein [Litorihabitans aurantiacus]|uniref:RNA-binding protein n=1 Tax=Litorihabitans aurantiacus TaxID=1930061 RepID=A0AA37XDR7_9MICO|nr:ASCH domain-containing protein [Litorihabitans aurantiacus]GMA30767.1 RNA-binding protein [Litorihabitans aurantiacus]